MTIEELKQKKLNLESKLDDLLTKFVLETNCEIETIFLLPARDFKTKEIIMYQTKVEVKL